MILPTQQNHFHSGIDKLSIRDIMNIHDLSGNYPVSNSFPQQIVPPQQNMQINKAVYNHYKNNMPEQLIPQSSLSNNNNLAYHKIIPQQLIPEPQIRYPPSHIQSQQSIVLQTLEEYRRKRKENQENRRNKSSRKRIFERIKPQSYGDQSQVKRKSSKSFGKQSSGIRLVSHSDKVNSLKMNKQTSSQIISQKCRLQKLQNNSEVNNDGQAGKTLFTNKQFEKALTSGIINSTQNMRASNSKNTKTQQQNLNNLQSLPQQNNIMNTQNQFNQRNNYDIRQIKDQQLCIWDVFAKYKQKIIQFIQKSLDKSFQLSKKVLTNIQHMQQKLPQSPFTVLTHIQQIQQPRINIQRLQKRIDKVQLKLQQHDQSISSLKSNVGFSNKKTYENIQSNIQGKKSMQKNQQSSLILQREKRIENLKKENSRLLLASEQGAKTSSAHSESIRSTKLQDCTSPFITSQQNHQGKTNLQSGKINSMMKKQKPKYFILSSPEERQNLRNQRNIAMRDNSQKQTYALSPFSVPKKKLN